MPRQARDKRKGKAPGIHTLAFPPPAGHFRSGERLRGGLPRRADVMDEPDRAVVAMPHGDGAPSRALGVDRHVAGRPFHAAAVVIGEPLGRGRQRLQHPLGRVKFEEELRRRVGRVVKAVGSNGSSDGTVA